MNLHCKRGKIVQKVDPVVERAIQAAVDLEGLQVWAARESEPLPAFQKQPPLKLTPATAFVLGRQIFKRTLSILTP